MPGQRNDHRAPRRDSYADVGARTRQSLERALAGGATPAELVVLSSVVFWTATWSRTEERVSLGQIAQTAGLWDGAAKDCPRWLSKRVVERLRRLEDLGAVTYHPGRGGSTSRVGLPDVEEGSVIARGGTIDDRERGALAAPLSDGEEGSNPSAKRGALAAPGRGALSGPKRGALSAPPPEDVPRTESEETVRGARARPLNGSIVGPPAARLSACAATDSPRVRKNAERVIELMADYLDPETISEAIDDAIAATTDPFDPGSFLADLECMLDEDQADTLEKLRADRRYRPLALNGPALAIADACPHDWTEHLEEAELVAAYLDAHACPTSIVREVLEDAARNGGLKRPAHAARLARAAAAEIALDFPAFVAPPARRIRSHT